MAVESRVEMHTSREEWSEKVAEHAERKAAKGKESTTWKSSKKMHKQEQDGYQ